MKLSSISAAARWLAPLSLAVACAGTSAVAQDTADVPDQAWYPEGYLAMRIAAAEEIAANPRDEARLLTAATDQGPGGSYNLVDCGLNRDILNGYDGDDTRLAWLALDVTQKRTDMARLGYDARVYEQALLDHERRTLAAIASDRDAHALGYIPATPTPAQEQAQRLLPAFRYLELAAYLEAERNLLQPAQPRIVVTGQCHYVDPVLGIPIAYLRVPERGGDRGYIFRIRPMDGEVWLINVFKFRVCERRLPNPWDHVACDWNLYEDDRGPNNSGRYMFEARWPDGTVNRGAKVLEHDPSTDDPRKDDYDNSTFITFRRN